MNHDDTFPIALWGSKGSATKRPYGFKNLGMLIFALGSQATMVSAHDAIAAEDIRRATEVREVALSRTGFGEVRAGNTGTWGEMGQILSTPSGISAQQRPITPAVSGVVQTGEFRSGPLPGYLDPRFGASVDVPITGANPGRSPDDGILRTRFALSRTFHIGEAEYQWFFGKSHGNRKNFDHGNGGY
jgi:hypothetical protein